MERSMFGKRFCTHVASVGWTFTAKKRRSCSQWLDAGGKPILRLSADGKHLEFLEGCTPEEMNGTPLRGHIGLSE
jgi:hypothetical protein